MLIVCPSLHQTIYICSPTAFPYNNSLYWHPLQTALLLKWGGVIVKNSSNKEWIQSPDSKQVSL